MGRRVCPGPDDVEAADCKSAMRRPAKKVALLPLIRPKCKRAFRIARIRRYRADDIIAAMAERRPPPPAPSDAKGGRVRCGGDLKAATAAGCRRSADSFRAEHDGWSDLDGRQSAGG